MLDPFAPGLSVAEADRLHERLRAAGPVVEATDADGLRVWIITRYDDVSRLLADPGIVNVRPGGPSGSPGLPLPPALARNLLNMVPDDHRRVRMLAAPAFSRRRIGAVRQIVTARVDGLLDDLAPNEAGVVDLFPAYASPLPADIIAEILGVTDADADEFRTAAATVMAMNPGEPTADDPRIPAMTTIVLVLMRVIEAKRKSPGDDAITDWITARDAEDRLTEEELISLAFLTFLAGFENSVYQIANAIGILAGLDRDQLLVEMADDQLWRDRVTQLVLDAAPGSYAIRRFPVEDITVGGTRIPTGSPLYLSLRAATNDPARGDRPDLAFGRGPHYCLGADLAVMQLDIATRRLFQRHPGLSLVKPWETLDRRHTWRTHGPTEIPVNLTDPKASTGETDIPMTADALVRAPAEPTHPIREWTTVFVGTGDEHHVVAEGPKHRDWRKIGNVFRGPARTAVLGLIRKCIADRELKIDTFEGKVAEALGPVGAAHPILTPDKNVVVAVQIWSGDPKKNPPDRPNVGAWEWVLSSEDTPPPPQLQLDPGAIELIGMSARHQDRSVFGPADLYTRSARLSDTLRHVRQIRDCQVDDTFDGTFTIRAETDVTRELRYAERCVEGPAGRRVRGICWDAGTDEALVHESMLDAWLSTMLASTSGMYIAVGDLSYQYPYWLKWVTEHVPGLGHGVSTGQTFALHEEDWPKIIEWVQQVRKGPVSGTVRARRGGGGWLKAEFRGFLLDPLVSDSIGVAVISPEIETIPDETF